MNPQVPPAPRHRARAAQGIASQGPAAQGRTGGHTGSAGAEGTGRVRQRVWQWDGDRNSISRIRTLTVQDPGNLLGMIEQAAKQPEVGTEPRMEVEGGKEVAKDAEMDA
ncbi:hypothetical protein BC937DRAFT_86720 [Endogone sp. FLAS-F59071]|nr:hypothetical protein BC937DRAFT_86720 [Endogone sp. FLAS-F59071]|eukprot:RUS19912.1 hypothetical protein BC937DRAFT_86720 [Endogone sp. FLAS-F59071]